MIKEQSTINDFQVLGKLGEGAFGQVYRVKRKLDGKEYAMKKVNIGAMKQRERDNALNEIRILASYQGEHIIGYKEAFYDQISSTLCIVMEYAEGGDLLRKIKEHSRRFTKFSEAEIWKALVHMTLGLKSLHEKKVLHRDLKSANIFLTSNGVYKLGDLNVSKVLKKDLAETQTGTPYYASPEVWNDKPYGAKSDIWSLGCVIYEMAALVPPFVAPNLGGLFKKITTGYFPRIPTSYSKELQMIISSLLQTNPKNRPSTNQLLENPILSKYYSQALTANQIESQLLKTIKFDPRNVKNLKKQLPKANYEMQTKKHYQLPEKIHFQKLNEGIKSCRQRRKSCSDDYEEKKLREFLKRNEEQKLKIEKEKKVKNRERIFSACGIHRRYSSNRSSVEVDSSLLKVQDNLQEKLPPKPSRQRNYHQLPPKPSQSRISSNINGSKIENNEKSKENLKNAGMRIVSEKKFERVRSARNMINLN